MTERDAQHPMVVVIGAGSLLFGRQSIWQMVHSPYLNGRTLALVDCDIDIEGPRTRPVGYMPRGLRGMQELVLDTHELTAEAVAKCDMALLRRAMMTDPLVSSIANADAILRELLEAERDALPPCWSA
jgi:alpha-galactosidase/6-phospho-beta-glucosidase family protein